MKSPILFLFAALVLLCRCKSDKPSETILAENKINVEFIREIKLSALIDPSYTYTPLETDSTPLIGRVSKIIATDSSYYILDSRFAKAILKFDQDGKFIQPIGKYGEGTGEYSNLMDMLVHKNEIEVYDGSNFSVLRFDTRGNFLEEHRIPYWVNEVYQFSDTKKIVYCPTDYSPDGKVEIGVVSILSNDLREVEKTFFPYEEVLDDASLSGVLTKYNQDFTYVKPILAEFYTIDREGELKGRFTADFGKYRWPIDAEAMKANQSEAEDLFFEGDIMSAIHRLCENSDYLTFHSLMIDKENAPSKLNDDRDRWLCLLDKKNNKVFAIKKVVNDIDGLPFSFPIATDGESFISVLYAEQLTESGFRVLTNSSRYASVKHMLDTLENNSNPVLLKFKFRTPLVN